MAIVEVENEGPQRGGRNNEGRTAGRAVCLALSDFTVQLRAMRIYTLSFA